MTPLEIARKLVKEESQLVQPEKWVHDLAKEVIRLTEAVRSARDIMERYAESLRYSGAGPAKEWLSKYGEEK